jgi:uncharacterized membrane protein
VWDGVEQSSGQFVKGWASFGYHFHGPFRFDGFTKEATTMKPIFWVGILLIVLGALALAYQGFDYTHQEKVLDVGPIHATAEEQKHVSIPPVLGGLVLAGGIALVILGAKKKS